MKQTRTIGFCVFAALAALAAIAFTAQVEAENTMPTHMTFVSASPKDDPITQWGILVHTEALKRMGIEFRFKDVPAKRAGVLANTGEIDGEMGRVADYNTMYPNLVRVEEHNRLITFSAFTTDPAITLDGWESLKDTTYTVDFRRGVKKCAGQLPKVVAPDRLSEVNTVESAIKKLLAGRIDIFVGVDALFMRTLNAPGFQEMHQTLGAGKEIRRAGIMEQITVHTWLHKRHQELVPQFAEILRDMKAEGLFEVYRKQVGLTPDTLAW